MAYRQSIAYAFAGRKALGGGIALAFGWGVSGACDQTRELQTIPRVRVLYRDLAQHEAEEHTRSIVFVSVTVLVAVDSYLCC